MENINFTCPVCAKEFNYSALLNKHLLTCDKYDEWIKNYEPPLVIECKKCNTKFHETKKHNC